jgi:hypothetical protein
VGRSTNDRTGLEQCIRCGKNNDRKRAGNYYYQDEVGWATCKLCASSGNPGGHGCNEETGATEFGDCWGLYTIDSDCKEKQNVYRSIGIAYSMFIFTVLVLLPFVFISGGLGSIAFVWRRDVGTTAQWMCRTTTKAYDLITTKFDEKMRRWREESIREFFDSVRRRQEKLAAQRGRRRAAKKKKKKKDEEGSSGWWFSSAEPTVDVDELLSQSLHACLGLGSRAFVALLRKALAADVRARAGGVRRGGGSSSRSSSKWSLSYLQFRALVSLLTQRLCFARERLRFRLIFKEIAGHRPFLERADCEKVSLVTGAPPLDARDLRLLRDHGDEDADGRLTLESFSRAMFHIATEASMRHLLRDKEHKNKLIGEAFHQHATRCDDDDDDDDGGNGNVGNGGGKWFLTLAGFKAASIELGLVWSTETIRDIQHAARQREAGRALPRKSRRIFGAILGPLETGAWHWCVALPLVVLALVLGPERRVTSFDLVVALLLSAEVLLRLACYLGLGRSLLFFLRRNSHNAPDAAASVVDVALVVLFLAGVFANPEAAPGGGASPTLRPSLMPSLAPTAQPWLLLAPSLSATSVAVRLVRLLRVARLVPIAKRVLPWALLKKWLGIGMARRQPGDVRTASRAAASTAAAGTSAGATDQFRVSFAEFRRFSSCSKADEVRDRAVWPVHLYREAFLQFDAAFGTHSGAVPLDDLAAVVHAAGHWPTEYQLAKMRQVLTNKDGHRHNNRDDNGYKDSDDSDDDNYDDSSEAGEIFFFDDFVSAMTIVRDEAAESLVLARLETGEKRSRRTRGYVLKQAFAGVFLAFVAFVGAIMKLAANLYVLAQTTFGNERLELKLASYAYAFEVAGTSLSASFRFLTLILLLIGYLLRTAFEFLVWIGSYFQFNFTEEPGGVDCSGVLSLMYFPTVIIIVSIVVVLFDSSAYVFLKVSPADYRHFVSTYMHQFLPKRELARIFEHFSIQAFVMVMERVLKNITQVVIANLVFSVSI